MNNTLPKRYRILILDAEFPSALTILRSLCSKGLYCDIGCADSNPISQYSRYGHQSFCYPDPLVETAAFIDFICQLLRKNNYDLVFPVTERSLIPLAQSTKLDPWRDRLAIADLNSLKQVLDKSQTLALAQRCQIPVPYSHEITTLTELEDIATQLDYPVVLKPGQSIPNADIRRQLSVCYAHTATDLINLGQNLLPYCSLLVQQYVRGDGTGIELLSSHGEVVYAFQHQRLHELPLTGGGSCYRKSITINPLLLDASRKLIASLNWHGVAMVEFKWQPETGEYWLMEINGRFWGSLPLAYAAGADFPYMLYDLLVNQRLPQSQAYRENIYCRKLSADIHWYEQVLRRSGDERLVRYPTNKQLITDLLFLIHPTRHFFDVQNWLDPLPGIVDLYRLIKQSVQRFSDLLYIKGLSKLHQSHWFKAKLYRRLKSVRSILFLCYGNINRSSLAKVLAEKHYANTAIHFDSAGFHLVEGRPADPAMVNIAAEYDIDLSDCSSKTINNSLLKQADIIFVMEIQQYIYMKNTYPKFTQKVFLLGSFNSSPDLDISDPYNQSLDTYRNCFLTITNAIENLKLDQS